MQLVHWGDQIDESNPDPNWKLEVEYEGADNFVKQDLAAVVVGLLQSVTSSGAKLKRETGGEVGALELARGTLQVTTGSVASVLDAKSGTGLAMAAAAHLALAEGLRIFSRDALLKEMKTAAQFYRQSYSGNRTRIIGSLLKDKKPNEPSPGHLALTPSTEKELWAKLAES